MQKLLEVLRITAKAYSRMPVTNVMERQSFRANSATRASTEYTDRVKGNVKQLGVDVVVTDTMEFSVIEINRFPATHIHNPVQVEIGRHSVRYIAQHALQSLPETTTQRVWSPTRAVAPRTSLLWRSIYNESDRWQPSSVLRVGWKRAPADISCPTGWALPTRGEIGTTVREVHVNAVDIERGAFEQQIVCHSERDAHKSISIRFPRIITQDAMLSPAANHTDPDAAATGTCEVRQWAAGTCMISSCNAAYRLPVCVRV
eukprot:m.24503 g.24503  ORF g.24503 m.24503 type:complete len:259 (-) comp13064_c1_seq2:751-1527(-)